jgi:agmatinase
MSTAEQPEQSQQPGHQHAQQSPRQPEGEPRGPVDSSRLPRYVGPATFARLPRLDEVGGKTDVAVVGVPFDTGVSYRPGARFGGNAVREASRLLRQYNPAQDASPFALAQVADAGDIVANRSASTRPWRVCRRRLTESSTAAPG